MGEEVEELVKRLRNAAESDHAKATILVRFNEPTGKPDWRPMGPSKTLSEELVFAADTIESLRSSLTRVEEERDAERKAILDAIWEERLRDDTGEDGDVGYNQAINDVLGAVRNVLSRPIATGANDEP